VNPDFYSDARRKFLELHRLGWTYKAMARCLGVSERVLLKWREELRLPQRRRGRRKQPEIR